MYIYFPEKRCGSKYARNEGYSKGRNWKNYSRIFAEIPGTKMQLEILFQDQNKAEYMKFTCK